MTLCSRVLALVVVLSVPLVLALASQTLAARPAPAAVPDMPVLLVEEGTTVPDEAVATSMPGGPRVVRPAPQVLTGSDESDGDEEEPGDG